MKILKLRRYLLLMAAWLCWGGSIYGQEVVAVLSSELQPYMEAYEGFAAEMEQPVPIVSLSVAEPRIGDQTRVVVAFGSKAALESYPDDAVLIYCMAPGAMREVEEQHEKTAHIDMLSRPQQLLTALGEIQPEMKRVGVLWVVERFGGYVEQLMEVGTELEVEVVGQRLETVEELPEQLRALNDLEVDALWVPPDPLLIDARSFSLLKEFSRANDVPLYAPTAGFVAEGAVASVAVSFAQIGREAAWLVQKVLAGGEVPKNVYPEACQISLNLESAAAAGLQIPEEVVNRANEVLP
jgi:ABC-type uncharacterized transport system substrate-binding protein